MSGAWRGSPDLPGLPALTAPDVSAGAFIIAGAGGNNRPAIAPHYTRGSGQQAAQVAAALLNNKRHRPRELLIAVSVEAGNELRQALARDYGVEVREIGAGRFARIRLWHLTLAPGQELRELLTRLLQDNRVLSAQPNYIYTPVQGTDKDKRASAPAEPPPPRPAGAYPAGAGVKLAIIDTCVDRAHNELQGSVVSSFDALGPASPNCEPENHGTAVASLIAGHSQLKGTAMGAAILTARAFAFTKEENEVAATSTGIWLAMNWAATNGAQIMNLSFAGPADPLIEESVAAAYRERIVLVAAAGNGGPASAPLYPAAYPEVIAVTAMNGKRQIYDFANRGRYIAVCARGVDVLVAHVNNTYGTDSGTSFAAAKVSGVVAALLERRPKAGPEDIRAALQTTATGVTGLDRNEAGFGLVNVTAAMEYVENAVPR